MLRGKSFAYFLFITLIHVSCADETVKKVKSAKVVSSVINTKAIWETLNSEKIFEPYLMKSYKRYYVDSRYEKILEAIGIDETKRKEYLKDEPIIELSFECGELLLTTKAQGRIFKQQFLLSQPGVYLTPGGRTVKSTFTQKDHKLIELQEGIEPQGKNLKLTYDFHPEELSIMLYVEDILCITNYKLVSV